MQQNQTLDSRNRIKLDPQSSEKCFRVFLTKEIKISGVKFFMEEFADEPVTNLNKLLFS